MSTKRKFSFRMLSVFAAMTLLTLTSMTMDKKETKDTGAYLEITLDIKPENRESAVGVYSKYKEPFLNQIDGAISKDLLIRTEDVQVLHGFESEDQANAYLDTELFKNDVVGELKPLLEGDPEIRIYSVFKN